MKQLNLRFPVIMMIYGVAVLVLYRDEVLGVALAPLAVLTARITAAILHTAGLAVQREEAILSHPDGFAYEIAYTCTGFLPAVTFIVCLLACSGSVKAKLAGIGFGMPALIAVNLLRLVHLYYLGVYVPGTFRVAHEVIWEALLAVTFIGLWVGWLNLAQRMPRSRPVTPAGPSSATKQRQETPTRPERGRRNHHGGSIPRLVRRSQPGKLQGPAGS